MAQIVDSRCVLAVRDLEASTRYYVDVLGFRKDPINARRVSTTLRHSGMEFSEYFRVSYVVC